MEQLEISNSSRISLEKDLRKTIDELRVATQRDVVSTARLQIVEREAEERRKENATLRELLNDSEQSMYLKMAISISLYFFYYLFLLLIVYFD